MDPGGTAWNYIASDWPKDVTVLRANSSVVYADGREIGFHNGLYNHHLLLMDLTKPSPTIGRCPNGRAIEPPGFNMFAGSSEDKGGAFYHLGTAQPDLTGYYVRPADSVLMLGDVVNYTPEPKTVYALNDLEYVDGRPPGTLEAVTQLWSVGACDGNIGFVTPPLGQTKFKLSSRRIAIVEDGRFLAFRGHLHDGGVSLSATLNGRRICESRAVYGAGGNATEEKGDGQMTTIDHMGYCMGPWPVRKGDVLELVAEYDLEMHPPRVQHGGGMAEEMALMSVFFAGPDILKR